MSDTVLDAWDTQKLTRQPLSSQRVGTVRWGHNLRSTDQEPAAQGGSEWVCPRGARSRQGCQLLQRFGGGTTGSRTRAVAEEPNEQTTTERSRDGKGPPTCVPHSHFIHFLCLFHGGFSRTLWLRRSSVRWETPTPEGGKTQSYCRSSHSLLVCVSTCCVFQSLAGSGKWLSCLCLWTSSACLPGLRTCPQLKTWVFFFF